MDELVVWVDKYAALFVSICALFYTGLQAHYTRRTAMIAVRPQLTTFTTYETKIESPGSYLVTFVAELRNSGLGPANIESFEVLLAGKPVVADMPDQLIGEIAKYLQADMLAQYSYAGLVRKGHVLSKEEKMILGRIVVRNPSPELTAKIRDNIHVRVEYSSAYQERFIYDSRVHRGLMPPPGA